MANYQFNYIITAKCYQMGGCLGSPAAMAATWNKIGQGIPYAVDGSGWLRKQTVTEAIEILYDPNALPAGDTHFIVPIIPPQTLAGAVGVAFRINDPSNYYCVLGNDGFLQWSNTYRLIKVKGGVPSIIAEAPGSIVGGYPAVFDVTLLGSRITVKVNGATVFNHDDADSPFLTGSYGIAAYRATGARFGGIFEQSIQQVDVKSSYTGLIDSSRLGLVNSQLINGTQVKDLLSSAVSVKRAQLNCTAEEFLIYGYTVQTSDYFVQPYFDVGEPVVYSQYGNCYTYAYLKSTPRAPEVPADFKGVVSGAYITWSWTDRTSIENGYRLESPSGQVIANLLANTTSYKEAVAEDGITVTRRLYVYNNVGTAGPLEASVFIPVITPGAPSWFTGTAVDRHTITWSWSAVPYAESYELLDDKGTTLALLTECTYTETNLLYGTEYTRFVRAVRKGQKGPMAEARAVTEDVLSTTIPITPEDFTGDALGENTIRWTWRYRGQADHFLLIDLAGEVMASVGSGERSYIEYDLEAGREYTRILIAVDRAGKMSYPVMATATLKDPFVEIPCIEPDPLPRYVEGFASGIGDGDDLKTSIISLADVDEDYSPPDSGSLIAVQATGRVKKDVEQLVPTSHTIRFLAEGAEEADIDYGRYELSITPDERQTVEYDVTAEVLDPVIASFKVRGEIERLSSQPVDIPYEVDIIGYAHNIDAPAAAGTIQPRLKALVARKGNVTFNYQLEIAYTSTDPQYKPLVDIIWLVDGSGSMGTYQNTLSQNAPLFCQQLANSNIDYRLGVVAYEESASAVTSSSGSIWTTSASQFASMVTSVGSSMPGTENGLNAISYALNNYPARPGALRYIIILTDENADDYTDARTSAVISALKNSGAVFSAVYNPNDGIPYPYIAASTGGTTFNIGSSDWGAALGQIVANIRGNVALSKTIGGLTGTAAYGSTYQNADSRSLYQIVADAIASGQAGLPLNFLTSGYNTITSYRLIPPAVSGVYVSLSTGGLTTADGSAKVVAYNNTPSSAEETIAGPVLQVSVPAGSYSMDTALATGQTLSSIMAPAVSAYQSSDPGIVSTTPVEYSLATTGSIAAFTSSPLGYDYIRYYRSDLSELIIDLSTRVSGVISRDTRMGVPVRVSDTPAAEIFTSSLPQGWVPLAEFYCLPALGFRYGSAPFDGYKSVPSTPGVLEGAPDLACFIKDIYLASSPSSATIYIGYDDGMALYINGQLVANRLNEAHGWHYWDYSANITGYLRAGRNRIAILVTNGYTNTGTGCGSFDCELEAVVGGSTIKPIKRGKDNYGQPEALWWYYGKKGLAVMPENDVNDRPWYDASYGLMDLTVHRVRSATRGVIGSIGRILPGKWSDWGEYYQWDSDSSSTGGWTYDPVSDTLSSTVNQNGYCGLFHPYFLDWKDYIIETECWVNTGTGDDDGIGVAFRWQDERNFYYFMMDNGSLNGGLGYANHMRLGKVVDGQDIEIGTAAAPHAWQPGTHYRIRIEVTGIHIKVWVNDTLQYTVADESLERGAFGPVTRSQVGCNFKGFKVSLPPGYAYVHLTRRTESGETPVEGGLSITCSFTAGGTAYGVSYGDLDCFSISGSNIRHNVSGNDIPYLIMPYATLFIMERLPGAFVESRSYSASVLGQAVCTLTASKLAFLTTTVQTFNPSWVAGTAYSQLFTEIVNENATADNPDTFIEYLTPSPFAVYVKGVWNGGYSEVVNPTGLRCAGAGSITPDGSAFYLSRGLVSARLARAANAVVIQLRACDHNDGTALVYVDGKRVGAFVTRHAGDSYILVAGLNASAHSVRIETRGGDVHIGSIMAVTSLNPAAAAAVAGGVSYSTWMLKSVSVVQSGNDYATQTAANGSTPVFAWPLRPSRYYTTWRLNGYVYSFEGEKELLDTSTLTPLGQGGVPAPADRWHLNIVSKSDKAEVGWRGTDGPVVEKNGIVTARSLYTAEAVVISGYGTAASGIEIVPCNVIEELSRLNEPAACVTLDGDSNVSASVRGIGTNLLRPGESCVVTSVKTPITITTAIRKETRPWRITGPYREYEAAGEVLIRHGLNIPDSVTISRLWFETDGSPVNARFLSTGTGETETPDDMLVLTGGTMTLTTLLVDWIGPRVVAAVQGREVEIEYPAVGIPDGVEDIQFTAVSLTPGIKARVKTVDGDSVMVEIDRTDENGAPWVAAVESGFYYLKGEERFLHSQAAVTASDIVSEQELYEDVSIEISGRAVLDNGETCEFTFPYRLKVRRDGKWHRACGKDLKGLIVDVTLEGSRMRWFEYIQARVTDGAAEVSYSASGSGPLEVRALRFRGASNTVILNSRMAAAVYPTPVGIGPICAVLGDGTVLRHVLFTGKDGQPGLDNTEILDGNGTDTVLLAFRDIDPVSIAVRLKPKGSTSWYSINRFQLCGARLRLPVTTVPGDKIEVKYRLKDSFVVIAGSPPGGATIKVHSDKAGPGSVVHIYYETGAGRARIFTGINLHPALAAVSEGFIYLTNEGPGEAARIAVDAYPGVFAEDRGEPVAVSLTVYSASGEGMAYCPVSIEAGGDVIETVTDENGHGEVWLYPPFSAGLMSITARAGRASAETAVNVTASGAAYALKVVPEKTVTYPGEPVDIAVYVYEAGGGPANGKAAAAACIYGQFENSTGPTDATGLVVFKYIPPLTGAVTDTITIRLPDAPDISKTVSIYTGQVSLDERTTNNRIADIPAGYSISRLGFYDITTLAAVPPEWL